MKISVLILFLAVPMWAQPAAESTPDAATAVKLIEKNRDNPKLFNEGAVFKRGPR